VTRSSRIIAISLVSVAFIALALWIRYGEYWNIDACLDSGGAWDYSAKDCRH